MQLKRGFFFNLENSKKNICYKIISWLLFIKRNFYGNYARKCLKIKRLACFFYFILINLTKRPKSENVQWIFLVIEFSQPTLLCELYYKYFLHQHIYELTRHANAFLSRLVVFISNKQTSPAYWEHS